MSSIFDKAKRLVVENSEKAKGLIVENSDKVDDAVDRVADVVDKSTGRKHTDKVGKGATTAKGAIKKFAGD